MRSGRRGLDIDPGPSYAFGMEVRVNNPELQARINRWVSETGRSADELGQVGEMLDRRYDDIESGRVKLIDGEEAFRQLIEKP
jgi:hypothetical protein